MVYYSTAFKDRLVRRLIGPQAVSANRLAAEVGVPQATLSRWLVAARSVDGMTKRPKQTWSGAEKLRIVIASQDLDETALGALLRHEGVHTAQLTEWRTAAEAALGTRPVRPGPSPEAERIRDLERERRRKDRALAETAALLVLK
jgi:transposase-like protein